MDGYGACHPVCIEISAGERLDVAIKDHSHQFRVAVDDGAARIPADDVGGANEIEGRLQFHLGLACVPLGGQLPGGYGGDEPVGEGLFFDSWNFDGRERSLYYLEPISRRVTVSGLISDRSSVDWGDITLDGRMVIFAQVDREGSDIMLVENFR